MTLDVVHDAPAPQRALPPKIHFLCHAIRWAALAWIAWAVMLVMAQWSDRDGIVRNYGRMLGLDLTAMPDRDYLSAAGVICLDVAVAASIVIFVWRLFGHYLQGDIFTRDAVEEMRNVGLAALAAVAADIVARPAVVALMTLHLDAGHHPFKIWAQPNDALHLLMAAFVVVIAHIFKAGVDLAEDNRQIV
jgi:hypothetical protein